MKQNIMACALGFILAGSASASANDSPAERSSLAGLTEAGVEVEGLAQVAEQAGLSGSDLDREVQQRLRPTGLRLRPDAYAYLYVQITVADAGATLPLVYVINVSLMQEVTLPRNVQSRTPLQCPTWWVSSAGMASRDRLRSTVTDRVLGFVDQFVAAYSSVNSTR